MLNLESFVYRQQLAGIVSRWMINKVAPDDLRQLKRIVNFNLYISRIWLDRLTCEILRTLHHTEPRHIIARTKGQIKDFVVDNPTYANARIDEMRGRYKKFPEDFYRDTPIDGSYYVIAANGMSRLVACTRLKRFGRIAEKGARRIIDFMLARVRAKADELADERARTLGIARHQLLTPHAKMVEEFAHAERRVIKTIRQGTIHTDLRDQPIPDVAGIKLIVEDSDFPRVLEAVTKHGACSVVDIERHSGVYNAVNLHVGYKIPKDFLQRFPPTGRYLNILHFRGLDPEQVPRMYQEFLDGAEEQIFLEIIVSNFQEYLESEIGRCMHEERILSQRSHPDYSGDLATNVRHLMNYILGLCRGPGMPQIEDVPIKLWVKYMPDTIDNILRAVFIPDELVFDDLPIGALTEPAPAN
jgi:hypothetical protein